MMIYLIHFDRPLHHARHYVGFTSKDAIDERLAEHRRGQGAKILRALNECGIAYKVVRTWDGDRNFERRIKNQNNTGRYCPVCQKGKERNIK